MKRILTGLIFVAIGLGFGWLVVPGIWSDWNVRDQPLTKVTDIRVVSGGQCKSSARVLWICKIEVAPRNPRDRSFDEKFQYFLFGLETDQTFNVMRTNAEPTVYTTDLGLKFLSNRIATLAIVAGGFIIFGLWALLKGLRGE